MIKGVFKKVKSVELKTEKIPYFDIDSNLLWEPTKVFPERDKSSPLTLKDCLNEFASFEVLNQEENYFRCDLCKKSSIFVFLNYICFKIKL